jgi:type II secretory pathway pseudopilin PulG
VRPPPSPRALRPDHSGFALVIVIAGIAVMMILIGAATPTWRYVMQDDREQELFFRGDQIARAVEAYQRKNGNAFPPSFEVLVKGKFLRRAYKDPMTADGKWRIVRPGEAVPASGATGQGGPSPRPSTSSSPSPSPSASPSAFGPAGGTSVGVIAGVASRSHETSLRLFNSRTRYDQWIFLAGQPRRLGKDMGPRPAGGVGSPAPGTRSSPMSRPSPMR